MVASVFQYVSQVHRQLNIFENIFIGPQAFYVVVPDNLIDVNTSIQLSSVCDWRVCGDHVALSRVATRSTSLSASPSGRSAISSFV